jgi:hypothetical protein
MAPPLFGDQVVAVVLELLIQEQPDSLLLMLQVEQQ